jgi:hypothetical protein
MEAPWVLLTQKVTGFVEPSTNTLPVFVGRDKKYATIRPLLGSRRNTESAKLRHRPRFAVLVRRNIVGKIFWRRRNSLLEFFGPRVKHRNPISVVSPNHRRHAPASDRW